MSSIQGAKKNTFFRNYRILLFLAPPPKNSEIFMKIYLKNNYEKPYGARNKVVDILNTIVATRKKVLAAKNGLK